MGRTLRTVPVLGLLGLGALFAPGVAGAATYTVTTTADNVNTGALRWAINEAEPQPGDDTIEFDIAGPGPHTIALGGDLPTLGEPVTIDGYTETGARQATRTRSAELMIAIDAAAAQRGLDIGGDRVRIRGLAIHSAQAVGIYVEGDDNVVAGNHIGTNVAGAAALPNGSHGVQVFRDDNVIGGTRPADRNVIASNGAPRCGSRAARGTRSSATGSARTPPAPPRSGRPSACRRTRPGTVVGANLVSGEDVGIQLLSNDNVVQGNLVGTNAAGTAAVPNTVGVHIETGSDRNLIGGTADGEGNVISGNTEDGVLIDPAATGNDRRGQRDRAERARTAPIPNAVAAGAGVSIVAAPANTIGGTGDRRGQRDRRQRGRRRLHRRRRRDRQPRPGEHDRHRRRRAPTSATAAAAWRSRDGARNDVGTADAAVPMNTIAYNGDDGVTVAGVASASTVVREPHLRTTAARPATWASISPRTA